MRFLSILCLSLVVLCGCGKGIRLGLESEKYLATASQPDCGYLQNEYGQRVSWKGNVPVEIYVAKSIPEEFRQDIVAAADVWNQAAGKTILKINLNDVEGTTFSTEDQKNSIAGLTEWDGGKSNQQALTVVKYRGNLINSSDIKVNFQDFVYYSKEPQNSVQIHFESLMIHELGHTLGLKHGAIKPTVMWSTLASTFLRTQLSSTDQESVGCEY